ncbi:MAG TPA: transposase [Oligoflexia bacterium]|nr:transposase [Oligoflexia bacterium]HMO02464.1 transposase [Oligoflexia bacterium]
MARNIRDRRDPNNLVIHVTNQVWEGLPFVPNLTVNSIILGVLAKAQTDYRMGISVFLFMGNHYHMILYGSGNNVSGFMNYVDGEIAKRFKRLFPNRWGPKFWRGRYKEQHLATSDDVINKITYIFCNPLRAGLVGKIAEYPGVNSFNTLNNLDFSSSKLYMFTYPRYFRELRRNYLSKREDIELAKELMSKSCGFYELKAELFGWTRCFKSEVIKREAVSAIKEGIKISEQEATARGVIGAKRLITQRFDKPHRPLRGGRTPFIECNNRLLRKQLIDSYRLFQQMCRNAWQAVKNGFIANWPRGAFVPSRRWVNLKPMPV